MRTSLFEKEYFKNIIYNFEQNKKLGLSGGKIVLFINNKYKEILNQLTV
jgi:hypothetical protein